MQERTLALLLASSAWIAAPAATQVPDLPLTYSPVMKGIGAVLHLGFDTSQLTLRTAALTSTIALGSVRADSSYLPLFDVSLTGALAPSGTSWGLGVNAALLNSFSFGAGVCRGGDTTRMVIPLGAVIAPIDCIGSHSALEVYAAPVWNFERVSASGRARWAASWGSLSVTLQWQLANGVGFDISGAGPFRRPSADPYHHENVSLGIHFSRPSITHWAPRESRGCHVGL